MARPELGTKRVCPTTGRKFYDLNKDPIISPYTGQVVTIAAPLPRGGRGDAVLARAVPVAEPEVELDKDDSVELISLEEVEEEEDAGAAKAVVTDDDIEVEDDAAEEDVFLEEDEDEDEDVTDIIGDSLDDEEP